MMTRGDQGTIFGARRGSWNRTTKVGFDVVLAKLNSDGHRAGISSFPTGLLETKKEVWWSITGNRRADARSHGSSGCSVS